MGEEPGAAPLSMGWKQTEGRRDSLGPGYLSLQPAFRYLLLMSRAGQSMTQSAMIRRPLFHHMIGIACLHVNPHLPSYIPTCNYIRSSEKAGTFCSAS